MALNKKTVDDFNAKGRRVLVRCDFNVPIVNGEISDDTRIRAALPTIKKLIGDGAKLILCSHLGKVKNGPNEKESLAPVAKRLSEVLGKDVKFISDYNVTGAETTAAVDAMNEGDVILLQNTRFRGEEETKPEKAGEKFAEELAALADDFVCDAFGSAHRPHASVSVVTDYIRKKGGNCAVGYLMKKEIDFLGNAVEDPVRPFVAILGGAKVADKIQLINNLLDKADKIIIGGGMAFTFKKVLNNIEIGSSLFDEEGAKLVPDLMAKAKAAGKEIILPVDYIAADKFAADAATKAVSDAEGIPAGWMGLDVGAESTKLFVNAIKSAKTIVWNGPAGVFEFEAFEKATKAMADAIVEATAAGAITVIGGGDTATAAKKYGADKKVTHTSTGGGASLELLEGKTLPGVAFLTDK